MTTHFIETSTKDGQPIRIEVEDTARSSGAGFTRKNADADLSSDSVRDAYDQALNTVRGFADGIVTTIQSLDSKPSSAAVEFSVKVDAEAGVMIAKSRDAGQFKISLTWKQPQPDDD